MPQSVRPVSLQVPVLQVPVAQNNGRGITTTSIVYSVLAKVAFITIRCRQGHEILDVSKDCYLLRQSLL